MTAPNLTLVTCAPGSGPPPAKAGGPAPVKVASVRPAARWNPDLIATVIACSIPLGITAWGSRYYASPHAIQLRHPLHALLKPSGTVGLALGIAALVLFLFMWLYPFRKKVRALAWTGSVGNWMRVHIVAGLAIPLIGAVHAGWRFEGLIGLGYLSMLVVSLSGIVGRYLYTHIPRSRSGLELTMEEVSNERRALITSIAASTGLVPADVEKRLAIELSPRAGMSPLATLRSMITSDFSRGRALRQLEQEFKRPRAGHPGLTGRELRQTLRLARQEMALTQQVRMLDATRKVFGYWHVAHRPFAVTALLAILIHVGVAVMIGGIGFSGGH